MLAALAAMAVLLATAYAQEEKGTPGSTEAGVSAEAGANGTDTVSSGAPEGGSGGVPDAGAGNVRRTHKLHQWTLHGPHDVRNLAHKKSDDAVAARSAGNACAS